MRESLIGTPPIWKMAYFNTSDEYSGSFSSIYGVFSSPRILWILNLPRIALPTIVYRRLTQTLTLVTHLPILFASTLCIGANCIKKFITKNAQWRKWFFKTFYRLAHHLFHTTVLVLPDAAPQDQFNARYIRRTEMLVSNADTSNIQIHRHTFVFRLSGQYINQKH